MRRGTQIFALVAGQLGLHSAMAGLRMAAPLQLLDAGFGTTAVGVLLALFAAASLFTSLHAGRLADQHGYHRPVRLAVAVSLVGLALALAAGVARQFGVAAFQGASWPLYLALCGGAAASGLATNAGVLTIQRAAGVMARDDVERVRIFSWLGIGPAFSNVIGPVAVGLTIDRFGFAAGYGLLFVLPLATLAAARRVPPVPGRDPTAAPPTGSAWMLLRHAPFRRLLMVNWLMSSGWDVHTFVVPVLGHERGYSAGTIGMILGAFTLAVTLVRLAIPAVAQHLREKTVIGISMLGTATVFALYPLAPNAWAMGALALWLGLHLGSVQPMLLSLMHRMTPDGRHGEALAMRSIAMNTSSAALPLAFGALGAVVGAAALFWVVGAAIGAGSLLARQLPGGPGSRSS
jgi:MFS family permease